MRKLYAHILIIFTAFNVVSLNQFSKLPLLAAHYIEHWEKDHHIGFGTFLDMHYLDHDINDHDDKKDNELPFKSFDINSIHVFTLPCCAVNFIVQPQFSPSLNEPFVAWAQFIPTQVLSSLFRPPRFSA